MHMLNPSATSATSEWRRNLVDPIRLKPSVKLGLQLYAQGVTKSLKESSVAMGFHPNYLTIVAGTPAGKAFMASAHEIIAREVVNKQSLISALGMRAAQVTGILMEDAASEAIRLKAAQDIMDRDPELSKVQKHQVESFTLSGKDATELAAALTSSGSVKEVYAHLEHQDYNRLAAGEEDSVNEPRSNGTTPDSGRADQVELFKDRL